MTRRQLENLAHTLPEDSVALKEIDRLLLTGTALRFEVELEFDDGHWFWVISSGVEDLVANFADLPFLVQLKTQDGTVKRAFESYRRARLEEIENAGLVLLGAVA